MTGNSNTAGPIQPELGREEALFAAALALPPDQRANYLAQACGHDGPLRQRVAALLQAFAGAGEFLEPPLPAASPSPAQETLVVSVPVTEKPGDIIGRYKIREKLGEGGCGTVYMAEQNRTGAPAGGPEDHQAGHGHQSVIARFEAERQALAMMDHPNIAKVLDAGATVTGRPYFVMELVRGIRITEYCDQNNLEHPGTPGIVHAGLPCHSTCASKRRDPSGHQTLQHSGDPARRRARAEGDRLRDCQIHGRPPDRTHGLHRTAPVHWHARLHESRAGGDERTGRGHAQ